MNLLIFGASGGTGRHLVQQAFERGHAVTAFVRDPARLPISHPDLRMTRGDVTDAGAVARAVTGQDAVLVALGAPTPLRRYPALTDGLRHIVGAMEGAGIQRLIYLSFIGAHESRRDAGFFLSRIAPRLMRQTIADHRENAILLQRSRLEWTIVLPPKLTNGPRTGEYRHGETIRPRSPFPTISRADVADFMLGQLSDRVYVRKAVSVLH
jgi:putative NADH-flavin reductase